MDKLLQPFQSMLGVAGRFLLGLYFVLPGISKIIGFDGTTQYMIEHGVPLAAALLPITIVLQIGGGAALIVGWQTRAMALMLAGMTVAINLFMHDFWNVYEGLSQAHETQNLLKHLILIFYLKIILAQPWMLPVKLLAYPKAKLEIQKWVT